VTLFVETVKPFNAVRTGMFNAYLLWSITVYTYKVAAHLNLNMNSKKESSGRYKN